MKLVFFTVAFAACTDVSTGPATLARAGAPLAQSAYAVKADVIVDHVPMVLWELRFSFDPQGTSCAKEQPFVDRARVVLAFPSLGPGLPELPTGTIALANGLPSTIGGDIVAYYTDVDPTWTVFDGNVVLTATSPNHVAGTITGTLHDGGVIRAALLGTFDAPLCPDASDELALPMP
jgi:hypothetical protein